MIIIENGTVQDLQKLMSAQERAERLQAELSALQAELSALQEEHRASLAVQELWKENLDQREDEIIRLHKTLADTIDAKNNAYKERNKVVAALAHICCHVLCLPVYVTWHDGAEWEDDWRTVLFIQLPTGQASWHFHDSEKDLLENLPHRRVIWDGHTTEEKYQRLAAWWRKP
jgi:predicted Holliday junction resolvase-like endonuclease